jgi:hypothetical protein
MRFEAHWDNALHLIGGIRRAVARFFPAAMIGFAGGLRVEG